MNGCLWAIIAGLFRLPPADVGLVPVGTAVHVDAEFHNFLFLRNIPAVGRGASDEVDRVVHFECGESGGEILHRHLLAGDCYEYLAGLRAKSLADSGTLQIVINWRAVVHERILPEKVAFRLDGLVEKVRVFGDSDCDPAVMMAQ